MSGRREQFYYYDTFEVPAVVPGLNGLKPVKTPFVENNSQFDGNRPQTERKVTAEVSVDMYAGRRG